MKVSDKIRLYFADWNSSNISALIILLAGLGFFLWLGFNQPVGEIQKYTGVVESIGITNSSKYSASYSTARVSLENGKSVEVVLPRSAVYKEGDEIIVSYQKLLLAGGYYRYGTLNP